MDAQLREDGTHIGTQNLAIGLLKETTVVQTKRSDHITFRPENVMMAAIDFEVAEQGMRDRADLVERAVSQYLGHQKHDRVLLSEMDIVYVSALGRKMRLSRVGFRTNLSGRTDVVTSELARPDGLTISGQSFESHVYPEKKSRAIFVTEKELSGVVYYLYIGETDSKHSPSKMFTLRTFYKSYGGDNGTGEDGTWTIGESMIFQRSTLPWLIAALTDAEEALQVEVTKNRRQAQEKRAARTEDEVAQEQEVRRRYAEKYPKEQIIKAVNLAASHRSASQRHGLSEHFTWWEWLDLCARTGFRCPTCNEAASLTPHHRTARSKGGVNTIDNIEPVCRCCHPQIEGMVNGREGWLAEQRTLAERFKVGDVVQRRLPYWNRSDRVGHSGNAPGHVIDVVEPSCAEGPLWVSNGRSGFTHFHASLRSKNLVKAAVIVRWVDKVSSIEQVQPDYLSRFDAQAWNEEQRVWLAEQQVLLAGFQLGDVVYRASPKANIDDTEHITQLISPIPRPTWGVQADGSFGFLNDNPLKVSKTKARIRWIKNGSTKYSLVSLENLAKFSEVE